MTEKLPTYKEVMQSGEKFPDTCIEVQEGMIRLITVFEPIDGSGAVLPLQEDVEFLSACAGRNERKIYVRPVKLKLVSDPSYYGWKITK